MGADREADGTPGVVERSSVPRRGAPLELRRSRAKAERLVADMGGTAALPRKNGELVFEAPWESQAFGMAIALYERNGFLLSDEASLLVGSVVAGLNSHFGRNAPASVPTGT